MTSGFLDDTLGLDLSVQYVVMAMLGGGRMLAMYTEVSCCFLLLFDLTNAPFNKKYPF